MVKYDLDRNKAEEIFNKTAASLSVIEKNPILRNRALAIKQAALSDPMQQALVTIALGGAGAAAGALAVKGVQGLSGAKSRILRNYNIKQMQEVHPELQNYAPKDLHLAYNTLARVSPDTAGDPLMGGQFVKYVVSRNDVPIDMLNNISKLGPGANPMHAMIGNTLAQSIAKAPDAYYKARDTEFKNNLAMNQDARQDAQDVRQGQEHIWRGEDQARKVDEHGWKADDQARKVDEHGWKNNAEIRASDLHPLAKDKIVEEIRRLKGSNDLDASSLDALEDPNRTQTLGLVRAKGQLQQGLTQYDPNQAYHHLVAEARTKILAMDEAQQMAMQQHPRYSEFLDFLQNRNNSTP